MRGFSFQEYFNDWKSLILDFLSISFFRDSFSSSYNFESIVESLPDYRKHGDLILQINDQLSTFDASHPAFYKTVSSESEYINEDSTRI